jgi:predicted dehydrogenase
MKINIGIIGCGSITKTRHAPEYAANPNVNEVVYYDRNPERAELLAKKFGGRVALSKDEIMHDVTIDAISDCSANNTHHIVTSWALESGKHVLCEKPIANSIEEAEKMVFLAKKTGKLLMIAHNQRFTKAHQKAKEIIQSGMLGKVFTFKTNFGHKGPEYWGVNKSNSTWFFKKEKSFLGVAGDLAIHKIDLLRFLLDDEISEVSTYKGALDKKDENGDLIEVCDNLVGILKTKKGSLGTASFSWSYYGDEDNSTVIYFEKGMIKIYADSNAQLELITKEGERIKYELGTETKQTSEIQLNSGVIDSFINSIIKNNEPQVTGEDGLIALKIVYAMMESAESGKSVKINSLIKQ